MAWICIDAGTSVIKAVLLDASGTQLALSRASVPVLRPEVGHAEQDMEAVWRAVVSTTHEILNDYAGPIEGIATTAQGDGVWLIRADGAPVINAILWNDARAALQNTSRLHSDIAQTFAVNGSVPYPGLPSAILPWLRDYQPDVLLRARWSLTCNGWLHFKLTGKVVADLSDASNPFCDLRTRTYSNDLLEHYGISEYGHLLPPLCTSIAPTAPLLAITAQQLGTVTGIPVVMAPYDIVTATAGCGSTESGEGCLILGTTICAEVLTDLPGLERAPAGTTLALANGQYLRAMPTLTGCEAINWAAAMMKTEERDDFHRLARSAPEGAENLVFLPYLSPAGERSPFLNAAAKGSFHGLSLVHGREHIARAVLEGLSFVVRECLYAALGSGPTRLAVCGGGSRSDVWCQIIADVCDCEVARTSIAEVGAQGAFYYAQVATGEAVSITHAAHSGLQQTQCFLPNRSSVILYDELYRRFLLIREASQQIWELMYGPGERELA